MEKLQRQTIDTYNQSAKELAEYFKGIGPRIKYIDLALELAGNPKDARVLEIGCGDGRDAKEIAKRVGWYLGFDPAEEFINMAKDYAPDAQFEVGDATQFDFPNNLDVIYAFASLLHLSRDEVKIVLQKAHEALKPGGIFYISLKHRPEYCEEIKEDKFGTRLFYYYNSAELMDLAGDSYEVAKTWQELHGATNWFEIALRKV